ncbi:hypothetical protein KO519_15150 [Paraglaciecola agarilytica]|uniref:hypothetical protein n=1 Tax=Paraglaciecola chathamensis TaxID=368405 RepID=UPI001C08C48E|nr:hypothetical protein [Paraglaciecola agarilytica]MBU3019025.1 hypothetical protein [Paraglaciecola agarilytica]
MYTEINAAIQSVKVLGQIISANKDLANFNELASLTASLNEKLLDATSSALESKEKEAELLNKVRILEAKLAEKEDWIVRAKDYRLSVVGAEKNNFVYLYIPEGAYTKPKHWACPKCFEDKNISILNQFDRFMYICPSCDFKIAPIIQGGALASIESAYEP